MNLEDKLLKIFGNVNDWLKFAEAKNAALITFNGVILFNSYNLFKSIFNISFWLDFYIYSFIICLILSILISLFSFYPQTNISKSTSKAPNDNDNLIFYTHIIKYKEIDYLNALNIAANQQNNKESNPSKIELNYATQIITNAKIADRKYMCFKFAIWFTMAGILTPIIAIFLEFCLFRKLKN